MNPLYVGIDVSSKSNVVYFMLPDGSKHCNFSVANSHTGSSQLVKRILSAMTSCSLDTVLIGLEATSVYGDNLVYFLREDAALARFNSKRFMSSILSKSVNSKRLTMTCLRMISLILLLLLIACVSVESTKRYTSVTIVTKHFRTLHEHVISLFPTSSKKSNVL